MKQGVAAALDRLLDKSLRYAVVFDTAHWHPRQPPPGSEWDYDPFRSLRAARERMSDMRPYETEPEIWERREDGWHARG
ncbi:MAG TPA: hypothetical protein VMV92_05370 [Streptosporangiaceae bacterium]|nr:hypothetical protein [Streptosporangiaceae bacterium]